MKSAIGIVGALLIAALLAPATKSEEWVAKSECEGPFKGIRLTQQILQEILNKPLEDLAGPNLCGARLEELNLRKADLRRADLRSANLSAADLSEANLSAADLSKANL